MMYLTVVIIYCCSKLVDKLKDVLKCDIV